MMKLREQSSSTLFPVGAYKVLSSKFLHLSVRLKTCIYLVHVSEGLLVFVRFNV